MARDREVGPEPTRYIKTNIGNLELQVNSRETSSVVYVLKHNVVPNVNTIILSNPGQRRPPPPHQYGGPFSSWGPAAGHYMGSDFNSCGWEVWKPSIVRLICRLTHNPRRIPLTFPSLPDAASTLHQAEPRAVLHPVLSQTRRRRSIAPTGSAPANATTCRSAASSSTRCQTPRLFAGSASRSTRTGGCTNYPPGKQRGAGTPQGPHAPASSL
jgi:hypothetical protein